MSDDILSCECCGKSYDINHMTPQGDVWICDGCLKEFRAEFDACDHDWHPDEMDGEPGKYCSKCGWFVPDHASDSPTHLPAPDDERKQ